MVTQKSKKQVFLRQGSLLLVIILSMVLFGLSLTIAVPRATLEVKRAKEAELRFILGEYRRAVKKYKDRHHTDPRVFEDLLKDQSGTPFLRKVYTDPFTGKSDWVFEPASESVIIRSTSEENSLAGAPYQQFR